MDMRSAETAQLHELTDTRRAAAGADLLRFLTCGSVDDGKSTLIGRLLYDSKLIFEDQLQALERDSHKLGTLGGEIDFALLVDGLEAEREQGITIDVAYRYFATTRRSFIVADSPGHEQYTRNMATGASGADLAVILVDARKGVLVQTRRHSFICSLFGIRHVVLAVNKMDLVEFSQTEFDRIAEEYAAFAAQLEFQTVVPIPVSARFGDNVTAHGTNTPWYGGPMLLEYLETVDVERDVAAQPFRFPVQWVSRPNSEFRGFAGTLASGRIRPGEEVILPRSGVRTRVARIVTADGDLDEAVAGDAVTLTLTKEVDAGRGDLLAPPQERPEVSDQWAAHLLWTADEPLLPGRSYLMRAGANWVPASVTAIKHRVDVNTLTHLAARTLGLNEIAVCNVATSSPVAFDSFKENRETGSFILVDRFSNQTVAAGMIDFALRRARNIAVENLAVNKVARAAQKSQRPCILWFTGLSGSGKSTIARIVEERLHADGHHSYMLDGDNLRHGLNRDLGFTDADRVENIRRVGELAKLMVDAGLIVLCSFISPFRAERRMVRSLVEDGEFIEIFVDAPLEVCMRRDPKGLYKRAIAGQIPHFTGIDSPYEQPEAPELHLNTASRSAEELAETIIEQLRKGGYFE
jgi:bifunctional enzyme CysN/CysC